MRLIVLSALLFGKTICSAQEGVFYKTTHSQGWDLAIGILFDSSGNHFVWEKKGVVYQYKDNLKHVVIDISEEVGNWSDAGLLSVQLHPNFEENRYIYLYYVVDRHHLLHFGTPSYSVTSNEYGNATIGRLTRYTLNKGVDGLYAADLGSRKVLLGSEASNGVPILYKSHMIGTVTFGSDGTLLLSTGDAAHFGREDYGSDPETFFQQSLLDGIIREKENIGSFRSQLIDCANGKILRIDAETGDGVPSNPFYDSANISSARSKVWALGLRNPYRFVVKPNSGSRDPADGNPGVLFIGDVGMGDFEELNIADKPGLNFGWPVYEGNSYHHKYPGYPEGKVLNVDVPIGIDNCDTLYAGFTDLLLADKLPRSYPTLTVCDQEIDLDTSLFFFHKRPALDMSHWGPAHIPKYNSIGDPYYLDIKHPNAGVPVDANVVYNDCIVAGGFCLGNTFPERYRNTFFYADYVNKNIYSLGFDSLFNVTSLTNINSRLNPAIEKYLVGLIYNPLEEAFYCVEYTNSITKITYEYFAPPVASLRSDTLYGNVPLTVTFDASESVDPDGYGKLQYMFDFGDGTTTEGDSIVTHTFEAPQEPIYYKVLLTVTDSTGLSDTTTLRIWLNNTPPKVTIQRSHENYSLEDTTVVHLVASAIDNEQANLTYTWEVFLHHSDHNHPEPLVMDSVITFTIDPLGCGEESYYYSAKLVVSDSLGLATILELFFYPDCLRPRGLTADELTSTVSLAWEKSVTNVDAYLVLASTKDNITFNPAELETVETSSDYTDAPVLTDSSRVVYFGADTCAEVTHLRNFTKYHFFVFGKKDAAWSEASHVEATPKVFAPRIQSRDIVMNALDSISIEFSFSRGDGTFAAAFVTSDSLFAPKDFHYYTINKGDNFHIEVTAADSATMSGLKPLTSYFLKIFEFNEADSIPIYLTTQESNSISFRTDQVITSTEPGILKGPDISIYPVPVNTHIYIHWNDGKKDAGIEGRIFNMQGQLADEFLFTTTSHNGIYSRNIKNIPPGLFILQLRSDLLVRTFKIFKN